MKRVVVIKWGRETLGTVTTSLSYKELAKIVKSHVDELSSGSLNALRKERSVKVMDEWDELNINDL